MSWPAFDAEHLMVTSSQIMGLEHELFESGLPVASLMEKVGLGMASWFLEKPDLLSNGVLVLVGPGHNGGDGLVVARELHLAGYQVQLWCPFPIKKDLTASHLSNLHWLGVEQIQVTPKAQENCLWIEALFGVGQSRPLPELISSLFAARNSYQLGKLVSLDVPAGISSDTGNKLGTNAAKAYATLTVGLIKQGLVQDQALPYVGHLVRIDIGLKQDFLQKKLTKETPKLLSSFDLDKVLLPSPPVNASKYKRGRSLVIAGSDKYPGAALIALKGALASGVGSLKAILPKQITKQIWSTIPEVVFLDPIPKIKDDGVSLQELVENQNLDRFDGLLLGPGLRVEEKSWIYLKEIFEAFQGLLVLDADALNAIAFCPEGSKLFRYRNGPIWITPHLAEFQRLFPEIPLFNPVEAALKAADLLQGTVLLKGANSIVADSSDGVWQLLDTAPWTARAGLGDLLAGYAVGIGSIGVAARGFAKAQDLAMCALIHSQAARQSCDGGDASSICRSLKEFTLGIQSRKCSQDHKDLYLFSSAKG